MTTKTNASRDKSAHVAKFITQHKDYCAQFVWEAEDAHYSEVTHRFYTNAEVNKLVHSHLMTMTTRILKVTKQ